MKNRRIFSWINFSSSAFHLDDLILGRPSPITRIDDWLLQPCQNDQGPLPHTRRERGRDDLDFPVLEKLVAKILGSL